jgi:D-lactate dehydrogenase (cytochrome)
MERPLLLLVQLEFPSTNLTAAQVYDDIAGAMSDGTDSSITRFCRRLWAYGALDRTEIAGAPANVAARSISSRSARAPRPESTAGLVTHGARGRPHRQDSRRHDRAVRSLRRHDGPCTARATRAAVSTTRSGDTSQTATFTPTYPRSHADVIKGREAILEFGREVVRLGGSPLAEHGVGRSTIKQTLLRQLYGERGIEQMRAIKREIDPDGSWRPG